MRNLLTLLRLFLAPFGGWPGLCYIGLALLPIALVTGFFMPRLAFAIAVWDYVLLLAVPFAFTPRVLRSLLNNRRLLLVPGFAQQALCTALVFTLLQSLFLAVFALGYNIPGPHLRNAGALFAISSLYVVVMHHAVTTRWALVIVSLFPLLIMAGVLFLLQGQGRYLLGSDHVAALVIAALLGWMLAWLNIRRSHHFTPEHASVARMQSSQIRRSPVSQWMLTGGNALLNPDASLLLGYPATLAVRLRLLAWQVLLGPAIGTALLVLLTRLDFDARWAFHPGTTDIFLASSLFPATFAAYQNVEWVARLRLLWLRLPAQRLQLWRLLERQTLLSVALVLLLSALLTAIGLLFAAVPASLLLHYPLLVLVFNAFYSYYMICSRSSNWNPLHGMLLSFAGCGLMFGCLWLAVQSQLLWPLFTLELLVLLAALVLRLLARSKLLRVDWLRVKPLQSLHQPEAL